MIINFEDIQKIRPVYDNIDEERMNYYIREATDLFIIPAIGVKNYKDIDEGTLSGIILEGGYYNEDNCYCSGLKRALAYFTYARFLQNQQVQPTTYNVNYLNTENSSRVEDTALTYQVNQSKELGYKYLKECTDYLSFIGKLSCKKVDKRMAKIIPIGL